MNSPQATDRPELPPQSRITSRIVGRELTITIPRPSFGSTSSGIAVAMAFLGIVFLAQGVLTRNPLWSVGGIFFFLLAALSFAIRLRAVTKSGGEINLKITDESVAVTPSPRPWPRQIISAIRAEPPKLNLYLTTQSAPVCLLSHRDPAELLWIGDQISTHLGLQ